jgi:hypothetical protein
MTPWGSAPWNSSSWGGTQPDTGWGVEEWGLTPWGGTVPVVPKILLDALFLDFNTLRMDLLIEPPSMTMEPMDILLQQVVSLDIQLSASVNVEEAALLEQDTVET